MFRGQARVRLNNPPSGSQVSVRYHQTADSYSQKPLGSERRGEDRLEVLLWLLFLAGIGTLFFFQLSLRGKINDVDELLKQSQVCELLQQTNGQN